MFKRPVSLALVTLVTILVVVVPTVYAQPGYTNAKTVTLNLSATDNGSGMGAGAEMRFSNDGQNWSAAEAFAATKQNWDLTANGGGTADGTKTVYVRFKDIAGNWSDDEIKTSIILDTIVPESTATPAGGNYNQAQVVSLSSNEATTIYYTTDGSTPTTGSAVYTTPINIDSSTTLKFFAVDNAENAEAVKTEVYNIDTQLPVTTASPAGGIYNAVQTVTLTTNKPATIYYTTDGSEPTTGSAVYSSAITIATSSTLKFFAVDTYGNVEVVKTEVYTIDDSIPSGTLTINDGSTATNSVNISLDITETDDGNVVGWLVSETQSTKPAVDNPAWTAEKPTSYNLSSGDGTKTLYGWFKDEAGNISQAAATDTILLDTVPPTGSITISQQ
jgi:hypothetical protein